MQITELVGVALDIVNESIHGIFPTITILPGQETLSFELFFGDRNVAIQENDSETKRGLYGVAMGSIISADFIELFDGCRPQTMEISKLFGEEEPQGFAYAVAKSQRSLLLPFFEIATGEQQNWISMYLWTPEIPDIPLSSVVSFEEAQNIYVQDIMLPEQLEILKAFLKPGRVNHECVDQLNQ